MSRAPLVLAKAGRAFAAPQRLDDTTHRLALREPADEANATASIRWPRPPRTWPPSSGVSRADQDAFALRSQQRAAAARKRRPLRRRDRAGHDCPEEGRSASIDATSTRARHHAGSARRSSSRSCKPRRHGHRGQRLGRQRRRRRAVLLASEAAAAAPRPHAARARGRQRPPPASPRASWASARRRPCASCSRAPA